jgi:putative oxidoreductase
VSSTIRGAPTLSYGIVFLRVLVGSIFFGHGSQKLLGWWGGSGLGGTRSFVARMGFRPVAPMALLLALAESAGALFALGLLTPFAALGMTTAMLVAIATVHWRNGFWNGQQGYEFNLSLIAAAVAVAATGPGRFSLDRLIGWDGSLSGLWWGLGVLGGAALAALVVVTVLRRAPAPAGS